MRSSGGREPAQRGNEFDLGSGGRVSHRVEQLVATENYTRALDVLKAAGRDPMVLNQRGVCLMRMGRTEEAIQVFRDLVLKPGCTWMRTELPTVYKTNLATALALGGHIAGCLEILAEVKAEEHPTVQRLRAAIRQWERSLSLWQKLNWRFGRIEPSNRPLTIEGPAGDFDFPVTHAPSPGPASPSPPEITAA